MLSAAHSVCDFYYKSISADRCHVDNFGYVERLGQKNSQSQSQALLQLFLVSGLVLILLGHSSWGWTGTSHEITLGTDQEALSPISAGFSWDALVWRGLTGLEIPSETAKLRTANKSQPRELPRAAFSPQRAEQTSMHESEHGYCC